MWNMDPIMHIPPSAQERTDKQNLELLEKHKDLIKSFEKDGKKYSMYAALLVGANPAPSPEDKAFDPYRIPRVQGIEGEAGITFWLDQIEKGKPAPYVE